MKYPLRVFRRLTTRHDYHEDAGETFLTVIEGYSGPSFETHILAAYQNEPIPTTNRSHTNLEVPDQKPTVRCDTSPPSS